MRGILHTLGLDLNDESIKDTPMRVAKMYVNETFSGLLPETVSKTQCPRYKVVSSTGFQVSDISTGRLPKASCGKCRLS